jgi:deoxyhypusine synthase
MSNETAVGLNDEQKQNADLEKARSAILVSSKPLPTDQFNVQVKGPQFDHHPSTLHLENLLASYEAIGFQATSLSESIQIINKMVRHDITITLNPILRKKEKKRS